MTSLLITAFTMMVALIIFIPLRFMDLGMKFFEALYRSILLPFDIIRVYVGVLNDEKNTKGKLSIGILFFPILNFPQIITVIADVFLTKKARLLATKELLNELNGREKVLLIKELKKEGIIVKRKKIIPKRQAKSSIDVISSIIYGLISKGNSGDAHKHKFI